MKCPSGWRPFNQRSRGYQSEGFRQSDAAGVQGDVRPHAENVHARVPEVRPTRQRGPAFRDHAQILHIGVVWSVAVVGRAPIAPEGGPLRLGAPCYHRQQRSHLGPQSAAGTGKAGCLPTLPYYESTGSRSSSFRKCERDDFMLRAHAPLSAHTAASVHESPVA